MWSNSFSNSITVGDLSGPVLLPIGLRVVEWKPKPGVLTSAR